MTTCAIMPSQFSWPSQVVEHFESRGYQPEMEADNVAHTILTPEESKVSDETREILYSTLPLRFWVKTDLTETCWIWNGGRHPKGYGSFNWEGRTRRVSRVIWSILHGTIPAKIDICHKCDNPPCFNPSHLFAGTKSDNARDMSRKGRCWQHTSPHKRRLGEDASYSKLTTEQVQQIKRELAKNASSRMLAGRYGVSKDTINRIRQGTRWGHITIEEVEE